MQEREHYFSLRDRALDWLLEEENPSVRYLALRQLLDRPPDASDVQAAQRAIPDALPARAILEAQYPAGGYWVSPNAIASPRYRATLWQVVFLAQLGMPPTPPVQRACEHILARGRRTRDGRFIASQAPHAAWHCLNGLLIGAFQQLGYADDPRIVQARDATAAEVLRNGFVCPNNLGLPCAWGAVKVLHAFLDLPAEVRTPAITAAIERGLALLLSIPLRHAAYPAADGAVSSLWFALAFPLTYHADLLEAMTVLAQAGYAGHPYLRDCVAWLLDKQVEPSRWALEHTPDKTWASFGALGCVNKWVTLRALGTLKWFHQHQYGQVP
ncbi:MAG: hypothetical protein NZ765_11235 [Anaerolineae bacterium]|nr:hypothetical protein [Anaerolineae bacterium]MDW8072243.1 hypothetical protein [Anaerolineae bacterium]